jgi:hypothetical protein
MPLYTFHLCRLDGLSASFSVHDLAQDGATLARAAELLEEHLSCDHVDVWDGDRPVLGFHRFQPALRPVSEVA